MRWERRGWKEGEDGKRGEEGRGMRDVGGGGWERREDTQDLVGQQKLGSAIRLKQLPLIQV